MAVNVSFTRVKTADYITALVQAKLTSRVENPEENPEENAAQFADIEERALPDADATPFVDIDVAPQDTTDVDADGLRSAEDADGLRSAEDADGLRFVGVHRQEDADQDTVTV